MELGYLGNEVDTFKGAILRLLTAYQLLRDLAVDPMITDPERWDAKSYEFYSKLMGIEIRPNQPLAIRLSGHRRAPGIPGHSGDFFLDPSTGVVYGQQDGERYIFPNEVRALLNPSNVVVIYQAWPQGGRDAAVEAIQAVDQPSGSLAAVTCDRRKTSMLFFSRDFARIESITAWLRRWMGPGSRRILPLPDSGGVSES